MKGRCILRWRWLSLFFCSFLLILFFQDVKCFFSNNTLNTAYASVQTNLQNKTYYQNYAFEGKEQFTTTTTTPSSIDLQPTDNGVENPTPEITPDNENSQDVTPPAISLPVITPKPKAAPAKKPTPAKPPKTDLPIKKDNPPLTNGLDKNTLSKSSLEAFINSKNLKSATKYLIWINTNTQRTYIFTKTKDRWTILKTFICATGKDSTPTIKGIFKTEAKASWVYDKKYNCYLKNVTKIYKGYLMHSVILDKNGHVTDGTLGKKKSHGCVRLSLTDSEWIYKNLPLKTTIFIN
jgi:lipoprotein-anchoring transpeptidase ErfK/SrfK